MAFILNLDCSSTIAYVSIAKDGEILALKKNTVQKDHASFLHTTIKELLIEINIKPDDLSAISVADGPGSYTGLRVAMATAKGLAYSLDIPLICFHNFLALAAQAIKMTSNKSGFYIPVIDARRMEVFTATYDNSLHEIESGRALILTKDSFIEKLQISKVFFCGDAVQKLKEVINHENAQFIEALFPEVSSARISCKLYDTKSYSSLHYSEPYYIKPFFQG